MLPPINGLITVPDPCPHLLHFRGTYDTSHLPPVCTRPSGRSSMKLDPSSVPTCSTCGSTSSLYACATCHLINCHSSARASHALSHATLFRHVIALDVSRAEIFCLACLDQVYDFDFDKSVVLSQASISTVAPEPVGFLGKRPRAEYSSWSPGPRERSIVESLSCPVKMARGLPDGLRGLNNLGSTCFMNSVLQALIHTPPLRNYFLSDKHNRFFCQQKEKNKEDPVTAKNNRNDSVLCLACDMDALFSAVFSGDPLPYSPAKFLYSWWKHAENLASYEQQDAHEFFISMLDRIHEKVLKDPRKSQNHGFEFRANTQPGGLMIGGDCCIGHRVFLGILRSDVMCMTCGFTSTTYDPCVDISLDLEPNQNVSEKSATAKPHSNHSNGTSTLTGCLDRFTGPERLGSDQKFFCQKCQILQESLKQMSIKKLPLVSCFHIKRFEHSPIHNMSRKVDRYLQFPFSFDMTPYLSSSILRRRYGNRMFCFDKSDSHKDVSSEFELYAVITHAGKLDAGHYVAYLRLSNQWYKCDDAWITRVDENIVAAAQGYMMFYVQKMLFYKASKA